LDQKWLKSPAEGDLGLSSKAPKRREQQQMMVENRKHTNEEEGMAELKPRGHFYMAGSFPRCFQISNFPSAATEDGHIAAGHIPRPPP
jgi:hypothetical protein